MKQLKKHAVGYNTVSSANGIISARGVKSYPNDIQIFGYTNQIGEGVKSPDNPYTLVSLDSGALSVDGVDYEHSIKLTNGNTTIQVPVPIALKNVGNISDYIYKDKDADDVWKLVQNNKKYEFAGTEQLSIQSVNSSGIVNFKTYDVKYASFSYVICSHLNETRLNIEHTASEGIYLVEKASTYLRFYQTRFSTVDSLKFFLVEQYKSGTPLTIVYQLETPVEHTLSDYAQDLLNSFMIQNQNEIFVEGYSDLKVSGYIQK